jgi:hypothetical protein
MIMCLFQVKIRYTAEQKFETPVRANTLNPTWDFNCQLRVYDKSQPVHFKVRSSS